MTMPSSRTDTRSRRLIALALVAYAFMVTMLGTTLPTPLYPLYRHQLGFSELMITVIYATYAAGVIAALVLVGRWSDELGRRPMLLGGLGFSAASAVAFLIGGSLVALLIGRVLSGVSAGIFTGTATVAVVELASAKRKRQATLVATAVNMLGLGLGALLAGVLAQYAPLPLRLCFIVDLALLTIAVAGILYAPETARVAKRPRLSPQRLHVPASVRSVFVPAAIGGFAGFGVLGLFTAVAPAFLGEVLSLSNQALIGAVVFVVFVASTGGQLSLERVPSRRALSGGCLVLAVGASLVGAGVDASMLGLLIAGAVVAGFGQGLGFRAGMAAVTAGSPPEARGEVASTFFVVMYVALSMPVIGIGLATGMVGLQLAGAGFAVAMATLALIALLALSRRQIRAADDRATG